MERFDLNGTWKFKAIQHDGKHRNAPSDVSEWMSATVPGTVHTDLIAAGKIPDPFYRMNELEVQWVDSEQWIYQREFVVSREFAAHDSVCLVAEGLDTFAKIVLNGKVVGETEDMFVEHRFDVTRLLREGRNNVEIVFDSPTLRAKTLEDQFGRLQVSHESPRAYARKAQYSFGWDWGPKLTTSGIWRSMFLEATSGCRIKSVFARAVRIARGVADVRIDVDLERTGRKPLSLEVEVTGEGFEWRSSMNVKSDRKSLTIKVPNPRLWWPNGYGDQPLYRVSVTAEENGAVQDVKTCNLGIRTVRLLQERDADGKSFIVEINGMKVYCKGADWIPSDNFLPRIPASTYERLLTYARDAHMTMVRVWGGGIYEQDIFYELCDRLGLMVWQDFMFACSEYPEDARFLRVVKDEAEKAVTRLRNHPSIVLWCGNNECEWIFCRENPGKTPDAMSGAKIFRDLLSSVCRSLDGTRPYWRSSPYGAGFPNDESNGNHHQWDVWGMWKDYREYELDNARFVTEFGFQAPASRRTYGAVMLPTDLHPQSKVLEHHNKLPEGTERLYRFQASHVPVAVDFDDFVYKGQIVQAEALKTAVEHWRRRKFRTAGSMFWQLNDCWPVTSWSVIDSALRPKAAYFYAKKFFAPVLVSFRSVFDFVEVWITNDQRAPVNDDLRIVLRSFDGVELWTKHVRVEAGSNNSRMFSKIANKELAGVDPSRHYLHAILGNSGKDMPENRYYLTEPKHMQWQPTTLEVELLKADHETCVVSTTSKTLAKHVRIEVDGEDVVPDDNFFDVDPGSTKRTLIKTNTPLKELQKRLTIRSLWS